MENTVKELKKQINNLEAKIFEIENNIKNNNSIILYEEVCNLIDGIDITEGDYYAPTRLYSKIPGVKNIRFNNEKEILVKVESPKGCLLPKNINVRGIEYEIFFIESKNYEESLNY